MSSFANRVIAWQKAHGRHDLPWQRTRDPYRVWLSEIMLQQTQVAAVIPYYERFLASFPDVATLAAAPVDEVMRLWAGLGYYARARNLHAAAKAVMQRHGGVFPRTFDEVHDLPGIGRSTAAAILAFSFGARHPILDGNVKRVFARHFGVEGDVKSASVEASLWGLAEAELASADIESYTQGLMDLGATLCTRARPTCLLCPVRATCVAFAEGRTAELPGRGAKRETPHRETRMLVVIRQGEVLLEKRPPAGIWGGLWALPETACEEDALTALRDRYGVEGKAVRELARVEHGFTHYSLSIFPLEIAADRPAPRAMEPGLMWLPLTEIASAALPTPIKKILMARGA